MDLTIAPELRELDFDQYQRYGATALLLKTLLPMLKRPARILEVGCNALNLLPSVMPGIPFELVRCDVEDFGGGDRQFVKIDRDSPLPFCDGEFDIVVSMEVLEHIPAEDRLFAVSEWLRVASFGVILSCPNGTAAVAGAETRARRAYQRRHNEPHPFLLEHEQFQVPSENDVTGIFEKLAVPFHVFGNSPLAEWLPLLLITEQITEEAGVDVTGIFNRFLNERPSKLFTAQEAYRHIFVAFKGPKQASMAEAIWDTVAIDPAHPNNDTPDGIVDPVVVLARDLARVLRSQSQALDDALGKNKALERRLARLKREAEELIAVAEGTERCQGGHAGNRPNWLRRLGRWLRRRRVEIRLVPLQQVTPPSLARGFWESLGDDPQINVNATATAGWHTIRVQGHFPAGANPKLYFDHGTGLAEERCIEFGPWQGEAITKTFCFESQVESFRFDPLEGPGHFRIDTLQIQRLPRWRLFVTSLGSHLRELLRPTLFGTKLLKAASLLRPSRFKEFRRRFSVRMTPATPTPRDAYHAWIEKHRLPDAERKQFLDHWSDTPVAPSFAVLVPIRSFDAADMERTFRSLAMQSFQNWHLLATIRTEAWETVKSVAAAIPQLLERLTLLEAPVPHAESHALNRMMRESTADFIVPVDFGDQLDSDALLFLANAVSKNPKCHFVYSDEDLWSAKAGRHDPHFKPDWSPDQQLIDPYVGRVAAYRTATCRGLGGFQPYFDGAHEFDCLLRLTQDHPDGVIHVPKVLYHRASHSKRIQLTRETASRVVAYRMPELMAQPALPRAPGVNNQARRFRIPENALVSIVIPTAGRCARIRGLSTSFVSHCVKSIRALSTYAQYEVIVVDNDNLAPAIAAELASLNVRRISFREPFNLARKINLGASAACGDYLLLLNDDTEVISPGWLEAMLEFACRPKVGAVGAKLFFPDGRLQHAGVLLLDEGPSHPWYVAPGDHPGHHRSTMTPRNFLAVTGACLMTPRAVFAEAGGFDSAFPLNYNDVDYCLRLRDRGYRVVYTSDAELYHHEAVSKEGGASVRPEELELFRQRWAKRYPVDPYYNPNLSGKHCDYRLKD